MSLEIHHLLLSLAGWVIAGLLAMNMFFVRDFMKRMEKSVHWLTQSINSHSEKLGILDKSFVEKISHIELELLEINRQKKNGLKKREEYWG